jgi:hypothetical protein
LSAACSSTFNDRAPAPPRFILDVADRIETEPLGDPDFDQLDDTDDGGLRIFHLHEIEVALSFGRIEVGNRALVNAISVGNDATLGGLPEHFLEAHHRHGAGRDEVGQHLAGPDRWKLVDVADDQESGRFGTS